MSLARYIIIVSSEKVSSSAISTTQTVNCFFLNDLIKCIICPLCFYRNRYRDAYPKVILKRVVTLTASDSSSAFLVQTIRTNFWGAFLLILPFHQPYTVRTCSIVIIYRMPWIRFCLFVLFVFGCPPYLSSFTDLPLCSSHLRSLLPSESDLRRHDALALHHQQAAGTAAVPPAAKAFVAFQTRNDAVVSTAGAFWTASHLARLHLGLLLLSLREQNHFIFSSIPGTSVRPCHIKNFFRF